MAVPGARLHPVQTEGCAPLRRAWDRLAPDFDFDDAARHPDDFMWAWDDPHSVATGILDDITYDWLPLLRRTHDTGGEPIVTPEAAIERAYELAQGNRRLQRQRGRDRIAALKKSGRKEEADKVVAYVAGQNFFFDNANARVQRTEKRSEPTVPGAGEPFPQSKSICWSSRTNDGMPLSVWLLKYSPRQLSVGGSILDHCSRATARPVFS